MIHLQSRQEGLAYGRENKMTTYICTASVTIEIKGENLTDQEIEIEVKNRFFSEIETYKKDEVYVEVIEEQEGEN
jgi:hypothetical protein